jgi:hypothetical protein
METCLVCDGPLIYLGRLGDLDHYRCRNCGMEQNISVETTDDCDSIKNPMPMDEDR